MLSEPSDERVSSIRRSDINKLALLGLLGLGAPSSSSAYCPPNCRPGEEPTATQSPEPAPQQAAPAEPVETKIDLSAPESQSLARITDRAFLDVTFGGRNRSRIVIGLYGDVVPRTVENFKLLVTGAKGYGYNGTEFYRIVPGLQARAAPPRRVRGRIGGAREQRGEKAAHRSLARATRKRGESGAPDGDGRPAPSRRAMSPLAAAGSGSRMHLRAPHVFPLAFCGSFGAPKPAPRAPCEVL